MSERRDFPPFPRSVSIAGVLLLLVGCVPLLSCLASGVYLILTKPNPPEGWLTVLLTDGWLLACPCFAAALATAGLVSVGLRLARGRVADTLALGFLSTLLGLVTVAPTAFVIGSYLFARLATFDMNLGGPGFTMGQLAALGATLAVGLSWLVAGVLLLRGRKAYLSWKEFSAPP